MNEVPDGFFPLQPIGHVQGGRAVVEDDHWGGVRATIILAPRFSDDCLAGLAEFSHLQVVYLFDRVAPERVETAARHPRNNPDWPLVGIFAQRGKNRPNRIGVSTCRIERIEGRKIFVRGLDALDGTPVLDLKPVFREFEISEPIEQPEWVAELMRRYWE